MEQAQRAYDSARRFNQALTAMMLDVDHFKRINDRHGHHVGDQVLRVLADRCKSALRSVDLLGRYGGEEFAIVLPGATEQSAATVLAERIRRKVAEEPIDTDGGKVRVTISIGVATLDDEMRGSEDLFKRADAALYEAKQAGRNRVVEGAVA
jgi:diguanylate cyclase (GGDEF)-like protein